MERLREVFDDETYSLQEQIRDPMSAAVYVAEGFRQSRRRLFQFGCGGRVTRSPEFA